MGGMLLGLVLVASTLVAPPAVGAAPTADTACSVRYTVGANWGTGLQAQLAFTAGTVLTGWQVGFDLMPEQVVTYVTSGTVAQSGRHVVVSNASFNGNVPAGVTVTLTVAIHTNPTGTNVPPGEFVLNGQTCGYIAQPYVVASAMRPVIAEGGSTTLSVTLSRAPAVDTILRLPGVSGGITATPASLTFTAANWDVPQVITIAAAEDTDSAGQSYWLPIQQQNHTPPQNYIAAVPVITQIDND